MENMENDNFYAYFDSEPRDCVNKTFEYVFVASFGIVIICMMFALDVSIVLLPLSIGFFAAVVDTCYAFVRAMCYDKELGF